MPPTPPHLEAWMTGKRYTDVVQVVSDEVARVAGAVEALYPSPSPSIRTKLDCLSRTMRSSGFKGNVRDYYNPNNSYLSHVITTKLGIPISLAVVVIAVGRKLGLVLDPINFPRHFLLKCLLETGQELILDTFEGRLLTREENAAMHGFADDEYYARTSNAQLLLRMVSLSRPFSLFSLSSVKDPCALCSVLCALCSVLCALRSVLCALCSVSI